MHTNIEIAKAVFAERAKHINNRNVAEELDPYEGNEPKAPLREEIKNADFAVGSLLGLRNADPITLIKYQLGGETARELGINLDDIIPLEEASSSKPALMI